MNPINFRSMTGLAQAGRRYDQSASRELLQTIRNFSAFAPSTSLEVKDVHDGMAEGPHIGLMLQYEQITNQLSTTTRYHLQNYQVASTRLNNFLRTSCPLELTKWLQTEHHKRIEHLDQAFSASPKLPFDVAVYRGESYNCPDYSAPRPGEIMLFRNFISTSLEPFWAQGFACIRKEQSVRVVYEFRLKKGHEGVYLPAAMPDSSPLHFEKELILPRDSRFVVQSSQRVLTRFGQEHLWVKLYPTAKSFPCKDLCSIIDA